MIMLYSGLNVNKNAVTIMKKQREVAILSPPRCEFCLPRDRSAHASFVPTTAPLLPSPAGRLRRARPPHTVLQHPPPQPPSESPTSADGCATPKRVPRAPHRVPRDRRCFPDCYPLRWCRQPAARQLLHENWNRVHSRCRQPAWHTASVSARLATIQRCFHIQHNRE